MAKNTTQARADLRARLIELAEAKIAAEGLAAVKARPLAQEAGCAVGAIYNVFGDLSDLVLAVNARTFERMARDVGMAGADPTLDPSDALVRLAKAYLQFAISHPKSWRALFDVELTDREAPDWYRQELARLFSFIAAPLARAFPQMDKDEVELMTRGLFSSVHGIVWLGVENRISAVPQDKLETMIEMVISRISK